MGVREMAQSKMKAEGPAASPLPGASQEVQEEHEEVIERATLSGETQRAGQSLVDQGIGIMVAVIVIGAVAIPVAQEVLNTANLTGTTAQIVGYVPLALGVGLFVAAISIVR